MIYHVTDGFSDGSVLAGNAHKVEIQPDDSGFFDMYQKERGAMMR